MHTKECIISAGLGRIIQHKGGEDTNKAECGSEQVIMLNKKNESKISQTCFLFFCFLILFLNAYLYHAIK